jgi:hypothetical protein
MMSSFQYVGDTGATRNRRTAGPASSLCACYRQLDEIVRIDVTVSVPPPAWLPWL